ncbi:triphosphoribosyl-dephospho-CoA synthase [Methylotenera mobilis]|uniref:Triphosphoribosyl-dephospho-CoA protein n=1 Tax=Methylotenera mobilis (strain JLW8 / ATCC BAA-1282 / DSM 17540) TaxID=583345 RepID=C6WWE9_METML|nr:triphosphoribosyl-dephospho-CoA synthase [Methylotenera mobilis]ACT48248.1 triphosphoribosyl-dephospho-CoA protein [Methylotenera mobilis JLW8]
MASQFTPTQLALAYKNSCMGELQALKPGNVHAFSDGHGMTIQDFIQSADVSAEPIAKASLSVGERVFYAVEATQKAVGQNTNLGMLLLCAPLLHAASNLQANQSLWGQLYQTLNQLSLDDAVWVAKAIVLANPGGLGASSQHDVHESPSVSLLEMMRSAQDKDRVSWQYSNCFQDIVDFGVNLYADALLKWENAAWATTALYLGFLTKHADTHVVRKHGEGVANILMQEAKEMQSNYWATHNPKLMQKQLLVWDASLKARKINPGTSADLTVATLLASELAFAI